MKMPHCDRTEIGSQLQLEVSDQEKKVKYFSQRTLLGIYKDSTFGIKSDA